jgi:phage-related protein (TIGR01555 family)
MTDTPTPTPTIDSAPTYHVNLDAITEALDALDNLDQGIDGQRLDRLINVLSGMGYAGNDSASAMVMVRNRPIQAQEAWAYYINDPIARGEIDRIWDDGIRAPWDLTGEDQAYDWRSVESECADLRVVGKGGLAGKYGDLLGAAFVIPDLDDGLDSSQPLDLSKVKRIRRLHVVTCERLIPASFDLALGSDATATPILYELLAPLTADGKATSESRRIHHTRLWRFSSEELPPIENFGTNGYPPSKLMRLKTALDAYNTANSYTLNAMNTVSVMAMKIAGLRDMACTEEGKAKIQSTLRALRWAIDNLRVLPLDMDHEDYVEVRRNVDGFAKMSEVAKGWVLAASERPKLILWGEQPAGLNADSRGEVRSWYDQCEVHLRDKFEPYLNWVLELIFAARANRDGEPVPKTWTIRWDPLMSPAPDQIASQAQQWAAAMAPLVAAKIITPEEAHTTLVDRGIISVPIGKPEGEPKTLAVPAEPATATPDLEVAPA